MNLPTLLFEISAIQSPLSKLMMQKSQFLDLYKTFLLSVTYTEGIFSSVLASIGGTYKEI